MTFQEILSQDMATLLSTTEFGESVTYLPAGGGSYPIPAMVFREEPDGEGTSERGTSRLVWVLIRNSSDTTLGRASPTEAGDKITLIMRLGASAVTARVTDVQAQDAGAWLLRVEA